MFSFSLFLFFLFGELFVDCSSCETDSLSRYLISLALSYLAGTLAIPGGLTSAAESREFSFSSMLTLAIFNCLILRHHHPS